MYTTFYVCTIVRLFDLYIMCTTRICMLNECEIYYMYNIFILFLQLQCMLYVYTLNVDCANIMYSTCIFDTYTLCVQCNSLSKLCICIYIHIFMYTVYVYWICTIYLQYLMYIWCLLYVQLIESPTHFIYHIYKDIFNMYIYIYVSYHTYVAYDSYCLYIYI